MCTAQWGVSRSALLPPNSLSVLQYLVGC